MKKFTGILLGALLVACGVIYALDAFEIAHISFSLDGWWTLFLIVPCLSGMLRGRDILGNFAGLVLGVLLLLAARDVFSYDVVWKLLVPMVIVVLGIKMIVKAVGAPAVEKAPPVEGEKLEVSGVFHEENVDFSDESLSLAKVSAIFGGSECNLRNAKIVDGCQIDLACAFGGVDILLPENVIVKNNTFCLFGGISDSRPAPTGEDTPVTLYLNGFCVFGGAEIQ